MLLYGLEAIPFSLRQLSRLETTQGNHIKQCLGLSRTVHSTQLLQALQVDKVKYTVSNRCSTFYHSIFTSETPATKLNRFLLTQYIASGDVL